MTILTELTQYQADKRWVELNFPGESPRGSDGAEQHLNNDRYFFTVGLLGRMSVEHALRGDSVGL